MSSHHTDQGSDAPVASGRVSRRMALKTAGAFGASGAAMLLAPGSAHADSDDDCASGNVEPHAGKWRTMVLTSAKEFKVPSPPSGLAAKADLAAVKAAVAGVDAAMRDRIGFWDTGSPGYRWNQISTSAVNADPAPDTFRVAVYLNLAIYDATIATWAAKQKHRRKRPSQVASSIKTVIANPASPSYPSEHGAAAGAAVGVLSHLFPGRAAEFEAMAAEHAASRIAAGVEFPSDLAAGIELGRKVAAKVKGLIDTDGFGAPYPGDPNAPYPGGDGSYPLTPAQDFNGLMIGEWRPIVLTDVTAFRPPPPPAKDSPERAAEIVEVKNYPRRTPPEFSELFFWAANPDGRPEPDTGGFVNTISAAHYYAVDVAFIALDELNQKILEYRLDANPPRAARAYALVFTALQDAYIACWNAKYHYLVGRPIHFDATIDTLWNTYPLAAYPSGHSTNMTATATMLGYLFPRDAHYFLSRAKENAASRLWAGIHFTSDYTSGVAMGQAVGNAIIDWAKTDGS